MKFKKQERFSRKAFFVCMAMAFTMLSNTFVFGITENTKNDGLTQSGIEVENLNVHESVTSEAGVILDNKKTPALVPNVMKKKDIVLNPYMGSLDASIHNDSYGTDVVGSVAPIGIYPEISYGMEPDSYNATPNAYYDDNGMAVAAYRGGVAIKKLARDSVTVLGSFIPSRDEETSYSVQTSYSFVDNKGNIVFPTSHGHIVIAQTTDNNGNVMEVFKKLMDVDIVSEAKKALGDDIDPNILSIVYDYNGNLWFVSGGFRKNPAYSKDGFMGYLSREYIDLSSDGKSADISEHLFFKRLTKGEGAENGISSCPDGVVILTNKSCYLLRADNKEGVYIKWKVNYDSVPKKPSEDSNVTGIGLAWGGGSTPTLTNDLVLFTDNCSLVKLIAISMKSGEIAAELPIFDSLPETEQVSVENSILVYSPSKERASVVICNWFGAGNPGLDSPDADSSIQTYDNIYDPNWMREGNKYLSPGIERVDVIKDTDGWRMEKVWTREDIRDTSMLKLSTATGYLYGYWQNLSTNYWGYYILDFETGETKLEIPVSDAPAYNNMAVGMIADINGNALYCPTNDKVLLRLQDRFVYFPEHSDIKINLEETERKNISSEEFFICSGIKGTPVTYLNTASFESIEDTDTIAFRVNGVGNVSFSDINLYAIDKSGEMKSVSKNKWLIKDESGKIIKDDEIFVPEKLYEIHFKISDGDEFDLLNESGKIKLSVILIKRKDSQATEDATQGTTETVTKKETSSGGGSPKKTSYKTKEKTTAEVKTEQETEKDTKTESFYESETKDILEKASKQRNPFMDVPENAWYSDSVEYLYKNGIFNGISDTLFGPNKEITRGMAVTILGRMENVDVADYKNTSYIDVNLSMYYAPYIEWAIENNIAVGYGKSVFKPDDNITREQLALIIRNYLLYKGEDISNSNKEVSFRDVSMISNWALDAVIYCGEKGIISGDNNGMFNPKNNALRAEMASIIMRIITSEIS